MTRPYGPSILLKSLGSILVCTLVAFAIPTIYMMLMYPHDYESDTQISWFVMECCAVPVGFLLGLIGACWILGAKRRESK